MVYVVLICFTCPAITVRTVILRALDRVRGGSGRALGWLGLDRPNPSHTRRYVVSPSLPPGGP